MRNDRDEDNHIGIMRIVHCSLAVRGAADAGLLGDWRQKVSVLIIAVVMKGLVAVATVVSCTVLLLGGIDFLTVMFVALVGIIAIALLPNYDLKNWKQR